jgi:hypothetical protein
VGPEGISCRRGSTTAAYRTNSLPSQSSACLLCRKGHRTSHRSSQPPSAIAFSKSDPTSHRLFPVDSGASASPSTGVWQVASTCCERLDPAFGTA